MYLKPLHSQVYTTVKHLHVYVRHIQKCPQERFLQNPNKANNNAKYPSTAEYMVIYSHDRVLFSNEEE